MNFTQACIRNRRSSIPMIKETHKRKDRKADSTEAVLSGGLNRSSEEVAVMAMERRVQVIQVLPYLTTAKTG